MLLQLVLVNEQLVTNGFATWLLHDPVTEQQQPENSPDLYQQQTQPLTA